MINLKQVDENLNLDGKRVLLRVDFNVPINDGSITETSRIKKILPTIEFLVKKKAKIIIISHLGRPKGKIVTSLSLKPIADKLSNYVNQKVLFINKTLGTDVVQRSHNIDKGKIVLLENLRFYEEEESNSDSFAKELAKIGDIYINEAFSCSHRAHTSVNKITKYIDSYAGKILLEEVNIIKMLTNSAKRPVACIIGGSKISTKIGVITNLIKKVDNIIIVGAMANNFIKYKGYQIGKSLFEENKEDLIETIIKNCKEQNCNLLIPEDTIVSKNHNSMGQLKNIDNIDLDDIILDIGEKTIKKINSIIDQSKTVLWNGPAGYFEVKEFAQGSKQIAKKISENTKNKSLISIAGGGDTAAALNMFNCSQEFTYISTAGGAFLELLEGKILPGIKALEKNE